MEPQHIKQMRLDLKMTQEMMARTLNVSLQSICRWESGKAKPSRLATDKLIKLRRKANHV